jgi:hypothetical protein
MNSMKVTEVKALAKQQTAAPQPMVQNIMDEQMTGAEWQDFEAISLYHVQTKTCRA